MSVVEITRVIAAQVKQRRRELGLSQEALGAAMRAQGCERWSRTSAQKLETGRREGVTVEELLALSTVLGLPPWSLLADPAAGAPAAAGPTVRDVVLHHRSRLLKLCAELSDDLRFVSGASWGVHALDRALRALDGETNPIRLGISPATPETGDALTQLDLGGQQ